MVVWTHHKGKVDSADNVILLDSWFTCVLVKVEEPSLVVCDQVFVTGCVQKLLGTGFTAVRKV